MNCYNDVKSLPSGANRVTLHSGSGRQWIEKKYEAQLTGYPVHWPVSRGGTEAALLEYLPQFLRSEKLHFPRVYRWDPARSILSMEYCPGKPLSACSESELLGPLPWEELFQFLYSLQALSRKTMEAAIGPVFAGQEEIRRCMLREKIGVKHGDASAFGDSAATDTLCLGDLSLNNILWDQERFWLIDLECAHMGSQGYDAGQLLAMARARWADGPVFAKIERAFLESIPDAAFRAGGRFWEEKFLPFYSHKQPPKI